MTVSERAFERRYRLWLCVLFFAALALRLVFVVFVHSPRDYVYSDMQSYDSVALELLRGRLNPWHAFRPVGYSMLLAASYLLTDVSRTFIGVLQAVMAAFLVPWSAQLTRAAGGGRLAAGWVALGVAASLPLVFYCGLLLTEVPTAFFLVLGLKLLIETRGGAERGLGHWAKAGLCLGLAGALRPNILLLYPVLALYLLLRPRWQGRTPALLALSLAACVPLGIVSGYNSRVLGRVAGPAANGGINFYLNFADVRTLHYQGPLGAYWISPVPNGFHFSREELTDVPLFEDAHYYARGLAFLRAHPDALLRALENFREVAGVGNQLLWPNWPGHERLFRGYALGFFFAVLVPALLFWGIAVVRAVRRTGQREALLLVALSAASVVPVYFFLGDPRVRVPFDPLWFVLSALCFQALFRGIRSLVARRPSL